jgi:hypothetical protein
MPHATNHPRSPADYERAMQSLAAEAARYRREKRYWKQYAKTLEQRLKEVTDGITMNTDTK